MSNVLFRLGRWVAEHRRLVVLVWLAVVIGLVAANRVAGGVRSDEHVEVRFSCHFDDQTLEPRARQRTPFAQSAEL